MADSETRTSTSKKHRSMDLSDGEVKSQKPRGNSDTLENKKHKCEHCQKAFRGKRNLLLHIRTHTGEKPHECNSCQKSFAQLSSLGRHKRTHTGEKPHKCNYCPKSFALIQNMRTHERVHTGEKPLSCEYCGKSFAHGSTLKGHKRTHTGEKPFECQFCDYSATLRTNVLRHERTHTGERPYKCQFCSFPYKQKFHLTRHEKLCAEAQGIPGFADIKSHFDVEVQAHGASTRILECPHCHKIYYYLARLYKHMKTHTGEKQSNGTFCDYSAVQRVDPLKHERQVHAKTEKMLCQRELCSQGSTSAPSSLMKQKLVAGVYEQINSTTGPCPSSSKNPSSQCKVCAFSAGSDAEVAIHMSALHKLPVVTLRRLRVIWT